MSEFKILHVGDVHAEPQDLGDCSALLCLILEVAEREQIRHVLFEGDQYHTHAIMHVDVMAWWKSAFKALKDKGLKVMALVGNHDQTGVQGAIGHAMMAHQGEIEVIDQPLVRNGILFLPYYADHEAFLTACKNHAPRYRPTPLGFELVGGCETLVCHQTFQGSTYENGFYASDGIDPNLIPQKTIISGHIHAPQEFGKVWYTGAPRWRTLTDANVERAIWLVTYDNQGAVVERKPFSTGIACRQIRHVVDTPETPVQGPLDPKHQWRVDIKGPLDWVETRKRELAAPGVRIRAFPDQVSTAYQVRESEGIDKAFGSYLDRFQARNGTPRQRLAEIVKSRLGLNV